MAGAVFAAARLALQHYDRAVMQAQAWVVATTAVAVAMAALVALRRRGGTWRSLVVFGATAALALADMAAIFGLVLVAFAISMMKTGRS